MFYDWLLKRIMRSSAEPKQAHKLQNVLAYNLTIWQNDGTLYAADGIFSHYFILEWQFLWITRYLGCESFSLQMITSRAKVFEDPTVWSSQWDFIMWLSRCLVIVDSIPHILQLALRGKRIWMILEPGLVNLGRNLKDEKEQNFPNCAPCYRYIPSIQ